MCKYPVNCIMYSFCYFFRFAHLVSLSGVTFSEMWHYIKKLKYEFIVDNAFVLSTTSCFKNDSSILFSDELIGSKLELIKNHFNVNETIHPDFKVSFILK